MYRELFWIKMEIIKMTKFGYLSVPVILFAMAFSANAQDGKTLGTNADRSQDVLDVDVWLDGRVGYAYADGNSADGELWQDTNLGFNLGFNDSVSGQVRMDPTRISSRLFSDVTIIT